MPTPLLAVVCAWCNRIVTPAPAGAAITHTICPACMEAAMVQATAAIGAQLDHERPCPPAGYFGSVFK